MAVGNSNRSSRNPCPIAGFFCQREEKDFKLRLIEPREMMFLRALLLVPKAHRNGERKHLTRGLRETGARYLERPAKRKQPIDGSAPIQVTIRGFNVPATPGSA